MMRRAATVLATAIAILLSMTSTQAQERAAYLTLMGNDTLVVEWMEFGEGYVEATALIRGSRTTFNEYRLELSSSGELTAYSAKSYAGGSADGELLRSEMLDGGEMVTMQGGETQRRPFEAAAPASVPFIDMLHWPFEAAMRWQIAAHGELGEAVSTFSGRGSQFVLRSNDDGSFGVRHPSRGWSNFTMDAQGRILTLDGTGSTRAYDLTRHDWSDLPMMEMGALFADRPLGELSGRGYIDDNVAGAHFTGDHGVPMRRGRTIFGELLAYGVNWRTGANNATSLAFDRDITIDGEVVPAGEYTITTVPEVDGGVFNMRQGSGRGGNATEIQVRMRRSQLDEKVEAFDIRVVPVDGEADGRIELRWDDVVYWVPFTVN